MNCTRHKRNRLAKTSANSHGVASPHRRSVRSHFPATSDRLLFHLHIQQRSQGHYPRCFIWPQDGRVSAGMQENVTAATGFLLVDVLRQSLPRCARQAASSCQLRGECDACCRLLEAIEADGGTQNPPSPNQTLTAHNHEAPHPLPAAAIPTAAA